MVSFELKPTTMEEVTRTGILKVSYKDMLKSILNKAPEGVTFSVEEMAKRYPLMKALIKAEPGDVLHVENSDFEILLDLVPKHQWPSFHAEMYELILDVRASWANKTDE